MAWSQVGGVKSEPTITQFIDEYMLLMQSMH